MYKKIFILIILLCGSVIPILSAQDINTISPGDRIEIFIWNYSDISRELSVQMDGSISLPLIGKMTVEGLTSEQLEGKLAENLSAYVKHPKVSVIILKHSSWVVYIFGEVLSSSTKGEYDYYKGMGLLELCAKGRALTENSDISKITILRKTGAGEREVVKADLRKILKGKSSNIMLQMGDVVYVPRNGISSWNFVVRNILPTLNFIGLMITLSAVL